MSVSAKRATEFVCRSGYIGHDWAVKGARTLGRNTFGDDRFLECCRCRAVRGALFPVLSFRSARRVFRTFRQA